MSAPRTPDAVEMRRDRPRRRRLDAAARRATILEAAVPLFATIGYEQTRMADVAARIGVTEPVIFQNFGSKAELFAAALERVAEQAVGYLRDRADHCTSVREWLRGLLAAEHLDRLHSAPMFGVLFADAHRLQADGTVHGAMHRCVTRVAEAIAAIVRRGQLEGSIRDDVPPATLAWLVVSLIQAREFRRAHTAEPSTALEDEVLARTVEALAPRAPRPR